MHRPALLGKMGNGHSSDLYLKQSVSVRLANYEPGGRGFESLRARHLIKQQVSEYFAGIFYLLFYPSFFKFSRKQRLMNYPEHLVKNQVVGFPAVAKYFCMNVS